MRSLSSHTALGQLVNTQEAATEGENGGSGPFEPDDPNGPTSSVRRTDGDDEGNGPPPAESKIAYCIHGPILITLEDAKDRDLTGRKTVLCLVLDPDQEQFAREQVHLGEDDVVSRILGKLPKRK